jgi:hypothetical protein
MASTLPSPRAMQIWLTVALPSNNSMGIGCLQDDTVALNLYLQSASRGNPAACFNVGVYHEHGLNYVCLDTRAKDQEEFKVRFQQFKVRFQLALDTKDTAQLCELLEGPGDSQAYDVDVGNDIIVRCHRKIVYPNGTVYIGFVDTATGLPDGEGSVTWGASAGCFSCKC